MKQLLNLQHLTQKESYELFNEFAEYDRERIDKIAL
jgi:hypothetical protein